MTHLDIDLYARIFCFLILLTPLLALIATAAIAVFEIPIQERTTNRLALAAILAGLLGSIGIVGLMLISGKQSIVVDLGHWVALPEQHFHFTFEFLFDRLSLPFLILSQVLSGVVGAFARVYLHREPGFRRFYLLYMLFVLGISVSAIAGTIETLFAGWEFVGLSSALLVAYFQERPASVRNGLRVWGVYRVADAAFLAGAIVFHHVSAEGDFVRMVGASAWPGGVAQIGSVEALIVGSLLLVAAAGKSGLIPFSGWLPRAMEGPTPSSAIFYGALSVHLGAFLLLRVESILERSLILSALVVILGLATAFWATLTTRVMSDIKGKLACASLTQVGLIVAEIGLGLRYLALAHIIGHAILRTLQLLRAPSLLHDYHQMESALGTDLPQAKAPVYDSFISQLGMFFYRWGYERSIFDIFLAKFLIQPFQRFFRLCGHLEQSWLYWLSGTPPRKAKGPRPGTGGLGL